MTALVRVKLRVTVDSHSEEVGLKAKVLGRFVRVGGKPFAAEVEVMEVPYKGRVTVVPFEKVECINDAARNRMLDVGPGPLLEDL